jgi:hypothetical protein
MPTKKSLKKFNYKQLVAFIAGCFLFLWIGTYLIGILGEPHLGAETSYGPWEFCGDKKVTANRYYIYISCVNDEHPYLYPLTRSLLQTGSIALAISISSILAVLPIILLKIAKKYKLSYIIQYTIFTITASIEFYLLYRLLLLWINSKQM